MSAAPDVGEQLKKCTTCHEEKPATSEHFELHKQCRGGISSRCKTCSNARAKKWRTDNREMLSRRWKERYAPGHKAAARKLDRHYREYQPQISRSFAMRNAMRTRINAGVPGDIEYLTSRRLLDMLLATPSCPICTIALTYPARYENRGGQSASPSSASLDRIIPALGYVRENVAIICWRCNTLKRDALLPELERLVVWLRKVSPQ